MYPKIVNPINWTKNLNYKEQYIAKKYALFSFIIHFIAVSEMKIVYFLWYLNFLKKNIICSQSLSVSIKLEFSNIKLLTQFYQGYISIYSSIFNMRKIYWWFVFIQKLGNSWLSSILSLFCSISVWIQLNKL